MRLFRKFGKLILLLSLPALLLLFNNQLTNWHYHILKDGTVVKHAHPYTSDSDGKTPYQQHQHSDFEMALLAHLSEISTLLVFAIFLAGLFRQRPEPKIPLASSNVALSNPFLKSCSLRAPPVFVFNI